MTPSPPNRFQICTRVLLALLTLMGILSGLLAVRDGVRVDTDLKSLSPAITRDKVINESLDKMSRIAASQFTLVVTHADADELEDASDALRLLIEENADVVQYVDRTTVLEDYLAGLSQQPFSFLTESAQTALQTHSDEQLTRAAMARLYGSSGNLRLLPVQQDPMGYASDFALQAVDLLGGAANDEATAATIAGAPVYYIAHNLTLVSNVLDMNSQAQAQAVVSKLEAELARQYPGTEFLHSGIFFFAADAAQSSKKDISLITTGSALGVILLVLLVFRNIKALFLPVLSILSGTLFAFLICQSLFGAIHIFTLIFGASLIGVVIDYSLHFFYFHSHKTHTLNVHLQRALMLSLFTSLIGYSALSWSGLEALKQVALFSGLGLIFSWLVVVTLGPLLARDITIHDRWLNASVDSTLLAFSKIKTSLWILGLAATGLVLLFLSGFQLSSDDRPRALFSPNPLLVQQEQTVSRLVSSTEPGSFVLVRAESAQRVYELIESLEQQLPATSNKLVGVHHFFPSPEKSTQAYQLNHRLYGEEGLALTFMEEQNFSPQVIDALTAHYARGEPQWLAPTSFFARHQEQLPPLWVEHDGTISTFLLIPKTLDLQLLKAAANEIDGVFYISAMEETSTALGQLRHSALWLLLLAFALVVLLMLLRFRSLRLSLAILCVPVCAVVGTLLCLGALGVSMTLFHVMALFLVLGLGMDYVIFVIEIEGHTQQTLSAIVLSAVTSLLSFGLLAASDLPAVSGFGLSVLIGNTLNLFGSLILASRKISAATASSASQNF